MRCLLPLAVAWMFSGCAGGSSFDDPRASEFLNPASVRENTVSLAESVKEMSKSGESAELKAFLEEQQPTFVGYAENDKDPNHAVYVELKEAWNKLVSQAGDAKGSAFAEELKQIIEKAKALPET